MKKYIIYTLCILAFSWGCTSANKADSHEGHDHSHESHDHEGHTHEDGKECNGDHDHTHDHSDEKEHNHDHEGHDHSHSEKTDSHDEFTDEIIFTPQQAKAAGVQYYTVAPVNFSQVIKTSGQILSASGDEVTVSATMSGIVSFNKSSVSEGLAVRAGEPLVSISSRNIVDGDPIAKTKSTFDIAQKEFNRAESLIKDKLIAEKEYNEIKLNYENAKIAYQALAKNQTAKGTSVSSSIAGFIKSKLVNEGQYVEVGQPLLTVAKNRKLQLRADVSERYYKELKNISSANFCTPYDKTIHTLASLNGRLVSYGRSAANQEYYVPVNFEFDNVGDIVSGSYVEVYLLGQPRPDVLTVPVGAVVEDQGLYFVYKQLDAEGYKKQEVKTGANNGEQIEILSGLKKGDKIVSKGAYHIKLASASASIPHGHEH